MSDEKKEFGKRKDFQEFLLIKMLEDGVELGQYPTKFEKYEGERMKGKLWTRERFDDYVKFYSFYNSVIAFGKEVLGYEKDELTGTLNLSGRDIKPLGKKSDFFSGIIYGAMYDLEEKGLISSGPANLLWGGEYFLTRAGAELAGRLKKKECYAGVEEIKEIVEIKYGEHMQIRRKNEVIHGIRFMFPGKGKEINAAVKEKTIEELVEYEKEFTGKAFGEFLKKENVDDFLGYVDSPKMEKNDTLLDYGLIEEGGEEYYLSGAGVIMADLLKDMFEISDEKIKRAKDSFKRRSFGT